MLVTYPVPCLDSEGGTGSMVPGFNMDDTCRNTIKAMEKHVQNEGSLDRGVQILIFVVSISD